MEADFSPLLESSTGTTMNFPIPDPFEELETPATPYDNPPQESELMTPSSAVSDLILREFGRLQVSTEHHDENRDGMQESERSSPLCHSSVSPMEFEPTQRGGTSSSQKKGILSYLTNCTTIPFPLDILETIQVESNHLLLSDLRQRLKHGYTSPEAISASIDALWNRYLESSLKYRYRKPNSPIRVAQLEYVRFWLRDYEEDPVFRGAVAAWMDVLFTCGKHQTRSPAPENSCSNPTELQQRQTFYTNLSVMLQKELLKRAAEKRLDPRLCLLLLGWDEYNLLSSSDQDLVARVISQCIPKVTDKPILYIFYSSFNDRLRAFANFADKYVIAQYHMSAIQIASGMEPTKDRVEWIQKAAEEGYPTACCFLSVLFRKGLGVPQDEVQEVRWLIRGSFFMHDASMILLAQCFISGKGVLQNEATAMHLVKTTVAYTHNHQAMFVLSNYFRDGVGLEECDLKKSYEWCLAAAQSNNSDAQLELGFKCLRGEGCCREQGQTEAWHWIYQAHMQGNIVASHFVEERERGLMRGNM